MGWFWPGLMAILCVPGVAAAQSPPPTLAGVASDSHLPTAKSDASPHPWRERPFALDLTVGVAQPLGLIGMSAEYAPFEYLSLGTGVGSNLLGWQLAGMARARFTPEARSSPYVGASYSQGRHNQGESNRDGVLSVFVGPLASMGHNPRRGHDWQTARWLNVEFGHERRAQNGFDLRVFAGFAFLLNAAAGVPDPPDNNQSPLLAVRDWMLYAGTSFGFAL